MGAAFSRLWPLFARPFAAYPGSPAGYEPPPERRCGLALREGPVCALGHVYAPPPHFVATTMPPPRGEAVRGSIRTLAYRILYADFGEPPFHALR